jgi:hypothetical protein
MKEELSKKEACDRLKLSMQKEINLMRELLANMHQEELTLEHEDKSSWDRIMNERARMIERLGSLREERLHASKQFEEHATIEDSETIEILSLRDQLMALAERMNLIKCQNEHLSQQGRCIALPQVQKAKRKSSVATYEKKS